MAEQNRKTQLITLADLDDFKVELLNEFRKLINASTPNYQTNWLKSKEVQKLLRISPGKLQTMRNKAAIPFTRIGGILYYDEIDIRKMMAAKE